jgi:hypothetical protein
MRRLILYNMLCLSPAAVWLALTGRFARVAIAAVSCFAISLLWPLPPIPAIAALVIALSLRRWRRPSQQ